MWEPLRHSILFISKRIGGLGLAGRFWRRGSAVCDPEDEAPRGKVRCQTLRGQFGVPFLLRSSAAYLCALHPLRDLLRFGVGSLPGEDLSGGISRGVAFGAGIPEAAPSGR